MQKTKSTADRGLQFSRIFLAFSMFPMVLGPSKYGWAMILPSLAMSYFSFRKYKEEKRAGLQHSKYGLIAIMTLVCVVVMLLASISIYLIETGYYD